ncbi:MAG TPA: NYN domain-containing protein [Solirubrobacterales bacterium]|nr:NYN domain-containing protein [Solirubrobacterales bacterium]
MLPDTSVSYLAARDDVPVHRVVDAMNVIGSRPDGWWRDRGRAIERLVGQVDRWAEGREERVTVMLEREPREALAPHRVEIAWATAGGADAADREILARLPGWLAEDEVVVVTSDRDLASKARAAGAEVVPSRPFRAELEMS